MATIVENRVLYLLATKIPAIPYVRGVIALLLGAFHHQPAVDLYAIGGQIFFARALALLPSQALNECAFPHTFFSDNNELLLHPRR